MHFGIKLRVISSFVILVVLMTSFLFTPFMSVRAAAGPPSISNEKPTNGTTNALTNPTLSITATDTGDLMTIIFRTNATGNWQDIGNYTGKTDGTYTLIPTTMNKLGTKYYWMACAFDGNSWTNNTYTFTTTTTVLTRKWTSTVPKSTGSVLIADINNDGLEEVIQAGTGGVVALNPLNGNILWNTPITGAGDDMDTQMADLNKDGRFEIIVPLRNPGGVHVLFSNGSTFWRTMGIGGEAWSSPVIADIDGSGYPTIFIGSMSELDLGYNGTGGITKLSWDGKILAHVWVWHICAGGLSIDDADHDGQFEIYAGDRNQGYAGDPYGQGIQSFWASNLTRRWADPEILCSSHIPMLADVNHDGIDEAIEGDHHGGTEVYNSVTGTPIRKTLGDQYNHPVHYQPTVYDIDGDGNLEMLMADGTHGAAGNDFVIWDLVTWQVDYRNNVGPCYYGPREADLTGDGIMDVIASSTNGIVVFENHLNNNYTLVANVTGLAGWLTYPVVQDMDGDGYLELVIGSTYGRAYAFDTPARAPAQRIRSEVQYYSERRLGAAEYVPPPTGPAAPMISDMSPSNGATDVPISISQLSFNLTDFQHDLINYTVTTSPNIGSGSGTGKVNGRYSISVNNLKFATTYAWTVMATDGQNPNNKTFTFTTQPAPPWWNTSWQYRRTITINHLLVSSDQTDFPILIDLTDSGLTAKTQSNGNDFVFTDANQVQLSHEIESYSSGTGHLVVWVKIPMLSSTIDTVLYMYYGNPTCGSQQAKTAVWDSSNRMILHLAETSGTQYDSTINGNNAAPNNGVIEGVAGKIDGSDTFDGTNDYLQIPHSDTLTGFSQGFTASFWLRLDDISKRQTILNKYNSGAGQRSWYIEYQANRLGFFASQDGTNYGEWHATFAPTAGTWYFITITWEPNAVPKFYVNGQPVATSGTAKIASIYNNAGVALYIGSCPYASRYLKGSLDEIRISNPARSAGWILTSYNNQRDPSTFYHVGTEEALPSEPIVSDPNPIDGATNVPITLTELSFNLTDYQVPNQELMNYYVSTSPDVGFNSQTGIGNARYSVAISGLQYSTTYTWKLNVTDGTHWTNKTYTFTTEPQIVRALNDSEFNYSVDNADLRANGPSQDWYESRSAFSGGDATLLTLNNATIGGDAGKKAALKNYGISSNAYLTQEFNTAQTGVFSVSFDINIDRIEDSANLDRTGNVYLGDDHITTNCPTGTSAERFVCLGFYDPTPGDTGNDIILKARTSSGQSFADSSSWITVATGLNYDTWITVKLAINSASGTYDVYVDGILKGTFNKYDGYTPTQITYISFVADSDARGDFYVDNVFAPAMDRYGLTVTSTGNGTVEQNPGEATYMPGTVVTLTANPTGGFTFTGWSGDLSGNTNPTTITMNSSKSVIATFTQQGSYDDVIFNSNFDMGNLRNVQYQSGDASGNRFYTGEQNHTTVSFADKHWWFYFSMDQVAGKTVTISLLNNEAADFSGNRWNEIEPVYSYDNINWERVPLSVVTYDSTARSFTMTVSVPLGQSKIWLAPLPPYNIAKRDALFAEFASSPYLTVTSLGTTPGGQQLKVATITDPAYSDAGKFKSYVIGQQHAGEVQGSWNGEGLIRFLLSDDATAIAVRRSYIFKIVPIVNVDGVFQGICRYTPLRSGVQYDLNRDWTSRTQPEIQLIWNDLLSFQPDSFNDFHSTINTEVGSPKELLTYAWSTTDPEIIAFRASIRNGGFPETVTGTTPYACTAVHNSFGIDESVSWENPFDELSTNPGVKLTVNDWRAWGAAWAKGNYLYFGNATGTLTVNTVGSGSVTKDPNNASYDYGTSVQLTATPGPGYLFSNWSGDLSGDLNPASIIITGNRTVTAVFSPKPANWWNTSWQYRRTITIDHTKVSSDQTDFPVLIDLTDSGLTTKTQSNGNDFVFTDANQVQLSHEIESYSSGTGHLIVWIKVPVLSSTIDTVLYMYYGNPTCGSQQAKTAVWDSSNRMILHLVETSGTQYDSTINSNNATPNNGVIQGTAGKIDGSDTFDGVNDYLQTPHSDTLTGFSQGFTASFWLRLDDVSRRQTILNKYNSGTGQRSWCIEFQTHASYGKVLSFFASQDGTNYREWHSRFTPTLGTWYYIIITWEPSTIPKFYVNGVQTPTLGTNTIASFNNNVGIPLLIGRCPYDGARYLKGGLDEVRISNPARNASWILTSYNNQQAPTTFYQLGTEEVQEPPHYTITVNVDGQGSVTKIPNQLTYVNNTSVQLTAVPNAGWTFSHWEGELTGTNDAQTLVMISNKTVNAFFSQISYTLTVNIVGNGSVSLNDTGPYYYGSVVTLTALPNPSWGFSQWTGDLSGNQNPSTIVMISNWTVLATFTQDQYTLAIEIVGQGTVTKDPEQLTYAYGTVVNLTAVPQTGWSFSHWAGGLTGSGNPVSITMDGNKVVNATFTQNEYVLTVTASPLSGGSVSKSPDQATYHYNDVVQLTATPNSGYSFTGWSGDLTGSTNPANITITGGKSVTANFTSTLQLYLPFTTDASDISGHNNNGVTNGGVVHTANYSGAYIFDGTTGYITVADNPDGSLDGNGAWDKLTIELWVRPDLATPNATRILRKGGTSAPYSYQIGFQTSNGHLYFDVWNPTVLYEVEYTTLLTANTWYHIVCVYQSGVGSKIYVNGVDVNAVKQGTGSESGNISASRGQSIYIGCRYKATSPFTQNYFDGYIDEVKIYSEALSGSVAQQHYDATKTVHADYTLTVYTIGSGTVAKTPDQANYPYGTVVSLTPTADSGYVFDHWEINGVPVGSDVPYLVTIDSNKAVTAFFRF